MNYRGNCYDTHLLGYSQIIVATTTTTTIAVMVRTSREHRHGQIQWFSLHAIYILFPYALLSFGYFVRKEFFLLVSPLVVAVIVIQAITTMLHWITLA